MKQHSPNGPYISIEEAAEYIGCHKGSVHRYTLDEGLAYYKIKGPGRKCPRKFTIRDIDEWLERRKVGGE